MFSLMSPLKVNLASFMFRESKKKWKKPPNGSCFVQFGLQGPKKYKIIPKRTLPVMIGWSVPFS